MHHFRAHHLLGDFVPRSRFYESPFGRLFPKLDPWVPPGGNDEEKEQAVRAFAAEHMFKPPGQDSPDDNSAIPAGYTYFGQFIDHDITFDPSSSLQRQNDPNKLRNFRTPRLDLDCVYGEGPHDEPFMYDHSEALLSADGIGRYFLIGAGRDPNTGSETHEPDLPRNAQGRALIGDMRNDENLIVSQLQLSFLKLHNRILAAITSGNPNDPRPATGEQFQRAHKLVRWTYQYVVWNDFAKRLVEDKLRDSILEQIKIPGSKAGKISRYSGAFYHWKNAPYIPVEFSVAAYRFGHSMVRPGYQVNLKIGLGVEKPIFDPAGAGGDDLSGFRFLRPEHTIQWDWFLQFPSSQGRFPQLSQTIDPILARSVFAIPGGPGAPSNPLATLNMLRNWRMEVPSGSAVAHAMGETPLGVSEMEDCLWVYILKEARDTAHAKGLGPVGGRIVGEVFGGLLAGDPLSYINCEPNWTPEEVSTLLGLGKPLNGTWDLAGLIHAAGMPIDADDVDHVVSAGVTQIAV